MSRAFRIGWAWVIVFGLIFGVNARRATAACQGMSVQDMISVTDFIAPYYGGAGGVRTSPDGKYVFVVTQAGDVPHDVVADELLVWRMRDIVRWLSAGRGGQRPKPLLRVAVRSSNRFEAGVVPTGVIRDVRWAADSKAIFFRARKPGVRAFGLYRAALDGSEELLSAPDQDVGQYDVEERGIVYEAAVSTQKVRERLATEENAKAYIVGSDRTLYNLLFPGSWIGGASDRVTLWRISGGRRTRIRLRTRQSELSDDRHVLSVSPDGRFAMMDLPVRYVPRAWDRYGKSGYPVWPHVGPVSLGARNEWVPHQFTLIRLRSGRMEAVVAAPDGASRMFFNFWLPGEHGGPLVSEGVSWAPNGTAVLLSNTFLPLTRRRAESGDSWGAERPCLAVVDVETSRASCVESLVGGLKPWRLMRARWATTAPNAVVLTLKSQDRLEEVRYCMHRRPDAWLRRCGHVRQFRARIDGRPGRTQVWVAQSLNSPPDLMAALPGKGRGRILYDPNAKLRGRCIGTAKTIEVSIGRGKRLKVGLLLPVNYVPGRRYPLVIQTHGYEPDEFLSAGVSGAFAARAFAASGMVVLQVPECPMTASGVARGAGATLSGTPDELSCNEDIFRAAIRYVVSRGLVDPGRVGIIGFSKTAEYVLAALERDGTRFAAAELIDGDLNTYTQYVAQIGMFQGYINVWEDAMIGAPPFGAGLLKWVARSPGFSIYKVKAPVLIQADGREGVLEMWEPYAILHKLRRPVDFVVIQSGTHPFSNPVQRLASAGMSVDWFRFWLEHERPTDEAEYQRWSELREMPRGRNTGHAAFDRSGAKNGNLDRSTGHRGGVLTGGTGPTTQP